MNFSDVLAMFNKKLTGSFNAPEKVMPENLKDVQIVGKLCAFTGYRPQKLPFTGEEDEKCIFLKNELRREIIKAMEDGYKNFMTGMALGVDTWAAEIVIDIKNLYEPWNENIRLFAAVPFLDQPFKWQEWQKERYNDILEYCDKIFIISNEYTPECMNKRNRFMVDRADMLIAVYDGKAGGTANTINMAKSKNMHIRIINPGKLQGYLSENESEEASFQTTLT